MSTAYFLPTRFSRKGTDLSPFFEKFFEDFSRLWLSQDGKPEETFLPRLDVTSNQQNYTIRADLPGMDKDAVSIEIQHGVLTLAGEKRQEKQKEDGARICHLQERSFGAFSRSFSLPDDVDSKKITATCKDGVLTITLPRKIAGTKQSIAITAA
jgi:HSP20 family protein